MERHADHPYPIGPPRERQAGRPSKARATTTVRRLAKSAIRGGEPIHGDHQNSVGESPRPSNRSFCCATVLPPRTTEIPSVGTSQSWTGELSQPMLPPSPPWATWASVRARPRNGSPGDALAALAGARPPSRSRLATRCRLTLTSAGEEQPDRGQRPNEDSKCHNRRGTRSGNVSTST